jgi:hypothetical protein
MNLPGGAQENLSHDNRDPAEIRTGHLHNEKSKRLE